MRNGIVLGIALSTLACTGENLAPIQQSPAQEAPASYPGVVRVDATHYRVARATRDGFYERPETFTGDTRIVTVADSGADRGVLLVGVQAGGTLDALGFREGDLVEVINGYDAWVPQQAIEAYVALRNADHVTIEVRRGGQGVVLNYDIK